MNSKQTTIWATGTVATNNITSDPQPGMSFNWAALQLIAVNFNTADATIKLQDSIDGLNWNDVDGATITIASGGSSNIIRYTNFATGYIRAVFSKGTNSAGTLSAILFFKES